MMPVTKPYIERLKCSLSWRAAVSAASRRCACLSYPHSLCPSLFPYLCDFSMLAIDLIYTNWTILGKGGNFPRFIFTIRCMICHDICTFSLKYGRNHCKITAFREKMIYIKIETFISFHSHLITIILNTGTRQ